MCNLCLSRRFFLRGASAALGAAAVTKSVPVQAEDRPLRIGYLPITDAAPLLVAHGRGFFEQEGVAVAPPVLLRSWAQLVEAFIARQVDLVHILSPLAVWARFDKKVPAKVVAWNHVDGSALTVQPDIQDVSQLAGKIVAVPFWFSIHNVVLQALLRARGLEPILHGEPGLKQVKLTVLAPPDMPPALAARQIAGFIVAEPFNAAAETLGVGRILRFTGDVWQRHACCVAFMHEQDLNDRPEWSQRVVNALVRAQAFARSHRSDVSALLSKEDTHHYTPQPRKILEKVLVSDPAATASYASHGAIQHPDWNEPRIDFQPYPFPSYTEDLIRRLRETAVDADKTFLEHLDPAAAAGKLVDPRFVIKAIDLAGGTSAFDLPASLKRAEVFRV